MAQETNMVFYPGTNEDGYGGLHDCWSAVWAYYCGAVAVEPAVLKRN